MKIADDLEIERAMVLFAHPDDAEFSSAGTAAAWSRGGVEVTYVLVTNGASGSSDPEMTRERLREIRLAEQHEAAEMLGVARVVPLDLEDGYLYPDLSLRKTVAREVRRFKPDVLIAPDPTIRIAWDSYVNHPDHIAVGEVALRTINPDASSGLMFPELWREEGFEPHLPAALLLSNFAEGNLFVDIGEVLGLKLKALAAHRSQHDNTDDVLTWVRDRALETGKLHGVEYAESYRMIRSL